MTAPDETTQFWLPWSHKDLAERCASLHAQRRALLEARSEHEINVARRTIAALYISGNGVEVGAGSRPFPIPPAANCYYGDVRSQEDLVQYFGTSEVSLTGTIDAQTMAGIPEDSLDFVISAHVIEHLYDPLGAIAASIERLRVNGNFLLVVPEMSETWDRRRPPTTLAHIKGDWLDGGLGTKLQAYVEHVRYVHPEITGQVIPELEVEREACVIMAAGMDVHVHAWRMQDFRELLDYAASPLGFRITASTSCLNENIFVLTRL